MKGQQRIPQQRPQAPQQRPVQQRPPEPEAPAPSKEMILAKISGTRFALLKWYILAAICFIIYFTLQFKLLPSNSATNMIMSFVEPMKEYLMIPLGVGVLLIIMAELKSKSERYVLTSKRIKYIKGLIGSNETSIEYEMVSHYTVSQNALQKLLRHGTIRIETVAGGRTAEVFLNNIPHIRKVKRILDERIGSIKH